MVFIPTYLYIKHHKITGKLYFGKSTRKESRMLTYTGSGTHWKNHINKYGKEHVITLWYELYDNIFDLVADALSMSKSFDIVNNKSWLNLIVENGLTGALSGVNNHMYGRTGINSPTFGIPKSEEHRKNLSKAKMGKPQGVNSKKARKGELNGMHGKTHKKDSMDSLKEKRKLKTKEENLKSYSRKKTNEELMKILSNGANSVRVCRISDRKEMNLPNFIKYKDY